MRENTFDVPAYKFFVLKPHDNIRIRGIDAYNDFFHQRSFFPATPIPFEDIDGLEVDEVRDVLGTDEICVFSAVCWKDDSTLHLWGINPLYFSKKCLDSNKDMTIDALCEQAMADLYMASNDKTQRIYRCFFERYQYKSYEKTKEKIRMIETRK